MQKLTKNFLEENALYFKQNKGKIKPLYNAQCRVCQNSCKQGCKVKLVACPKFIRSKS